MKNSLFTNMNKECKELNYVEAIKFIFDRKNLFNMELNGYFCSKCGLRQYHNLKHCRCGGEFKEEVASVSILYVRLKRNEEKEYLLKKLKDNIYIEIYEMLEEKYKKYYNNCTDYSIIVNGQVYRRLKEIC